MSKFKAHFKFNKQERNGVFSLLLIILLLQIGYVVFTSFSEDDSVNSFAHDAVLQAKIDALKQNRLQEKPAKIYPFNPNFITDYKGYTLGMSVAEIDRLLAFRKTNQYVNSAKAFQQVTLVSDSLLASISPYFKFPEWAKNKASQPRDGVRKRLAEKNTAAVTSAASDRVLDLNQTTSKELQSIRGIGAKLAARIIKFRDRLGGFLVDEQLYHVYGLDSAVVERAFVKFRVIQKPKIKKINLSWASYNELTNLLYISPKFANSIIERRNYESIKSFSELKQLDYFPEGKLEILKLYLSL